MRRLLAVGLACASLFAAPALAQDAKPPTKTYLLVALTGPVPGKEAEYNAWYTNVHMRDVLKLPGFKSAQRFAVAPENGLTGPQRYLSIFEIETDDLAKVKAAVKTAMGAPAMVMSPALDRDRSAIYYQPITPKLTK